MERKVKEVERKVKEVEQENIAAAALLPTVTPRWVLGAIAVNLETSVPGTSGFISSHQPGYPQGSQTTEGVPPQAQEV